MTSIRKLAAVCLLCVASSLLASEVVISHCYEGACPSQQDAEGEYSLIVRPLFAAAIDLQTQEQLPSWLAYRIVDGSVGVASMLPREWRADTLLSRSDEPSLAEDASTRLVQPDLRGSQDRDYRLTEVTLLAAEQGRLAPMTSFSATPLWDELNLLSNRARLPSGLRLGPWSRLDQSLNALAQTQSPRDDGRPQPVYVISGPLPSDESSPAGFFKIALANNSYAAFVFPSSTQSHSDYCAAQATLESLESRTEVTYFPAAERLSNDLAAALGCTSNR